MKNYKLYKNTSKRITALIMAGLLSVSGLTMTGCTKKENDNKKDASQVQIENSFDSTKKGIVALFPTMNPDVVENAALILMLDEIAKEDENEQIKANYMSLFKSKIDSDNMIDDFNSFLDTLEQTMIDEEKTIETWNLVIEEDSEIISNLESITQNIINGNESAIKTNFEIIYKLFVKEEKVNVNGLDIEIRNLSYSGRAVADAYARTSAYYARNYITEKEYAKIDERTDAQNSKAYIKTKLEVLRNLINEKSETNVKDAFNNEYESTKTNLNGKINTSEVNIENLVNVLNLEYLNSDKVSTKDKNNILGEYSDENVSNVLITIDAITKYNQSNKDSILLSNMLIEKYAKTETGKIDKIALDYIQYNAMSLLNTTNAGSSFNEVYSNGYFQNLYKALTKQNLVCKYTDGTKVTINYQDLSDGAKVAINEIILFVMNERPNLKKGKGFEDRANSNVLDSVQYIQNTMLGECKKVEGNQFVK